MRPQHITAENERHGRRAEQGDGEASMRPQHITAENESPTGDWAFNFFASMRPQHITAENAPARGDQAREDSCFNEAAAYHCGKRGLRRELQGDRLLQRASMRPQHITAENSARPGACARPGSASMRPQHITAENSAPSGASSSRRRCFNEAAAYHCGKPDPRRSGVSVSPELQ